MSDFSGATFACPRRRPAVTPGGQSVPLHPLWLVDAGKKRKKRKKENGNKEHIVRIGFYFPSLYVFKRYLNLCPLTLNVRTKTRHVTELLLANQCMR